MESSLQILLVQLITGLSLTHGNSESVEILPSVNYIEVTEGSTINIICQLSGVIHSKQASINLKVISNNRTYVINSCETLVRLQHLERNSIKKCKEFHSQEKTIPNKTVFRIGKMDKHLEGIYSCHINNNSQTISSSSNLSMKFILKNSSTFNKLIHSHPVVEQRRGRVQREDKSEGLALVKLLVPSIVIGVVVLVAVTLLMLRSGLERIKRKPRADLSRDMEYIDIQSSKNCQERDALMRFYAMLSVMVTSKGRPNNHIDKKKLQVIIKQPLESAFYKMFQAMLSYPSNRPLKKLIKVTCKDILYEQVELMKLSLGIQKLKLTEMDCTRLLSKKAISKMKESRMKIHEDTITRLFHMLELYIPLQMRPRVWDEQRISDEQWKNITLPISEAIGTFLKIMRQYPTAIAQQKQLAEFTIDTILPNCEVAMKLRGIKFDLSHAMNKTDKKSPISKPLTGRVNEGDMKLALGHYSRSLAEPSDSPRAFGHIVEYSKIRERAAKGTGKSTNFLQSLATSAKKSGCDQLYLDFRSLRRLTAISREQGSLAVPEGQQILVPSTDVKGRYVGSTARDPGGRTGRKRGRQRPGNRTLTSSRNVAILPLLPIRTTRI